jgi:TfoX/Sxy family transcriptional regulator of competence genes
MAYNEDLANRVREIIFLSQQEVEEKKMFGGLCFMVNNKMCIGVIKDELMVRLDPARNEEVLEMEGCRPMDFSGKSMIGFVFVDMDILTTENKLKFWINLALEYNPLAQASKKKKSQFKK